MTITEGSEDSKPEHYSVNPMIFEISKAGGLNPSVSVFRFYQF